MLFVNVKRKRNIISESDSDNNYAIGECVEPKKKRGRPPKIAKALVIDNPEVFCYCKEIEHGKMICCDNKNCAIKWFHLKCVNLTSDPIGFVKIVILIQKFDYFTIFLASLFFVMFVLSFFFIF